MRQAHQTAWSASQARRSMPCMNLAATLLTACSIPVAITKHALARQHLLCRCICDPTGNHVFYPRGIVRKFKSSRVATAQTATSIWKFALHFEDCDAIDIIIIEILIARWFLCTAYAASPIRPPTLLSVSSPLRARRRRR